MGIVSKSFLKSLTLAVALLIASPIVSEAQIPVDLPHTWTFGYAYARSATHPQNIGAYYEVSDLRTSWSWLYPGYPSYSLYTLRDAQNNFIAVGRTQFVDINTQPNASAFCAQQAFPIPGSAGSTYPGLLRQVWNLTPSPFGQQNLRQTVFCSGPTGTTYPWYVFVFDGQNPLTATVLGVFRS